MDKNLRPYVISCDWLQLYLHKTSDFNPLSENLFGYHFQDVGHGSKVFKNIYNVIEPTGEILGNISVNPYSSRIPMNSVIFKLENRVLYQPDYIERAFNFIACCGLRYKGITRIDIAYDSNELYGGLKHETLIKKYKANEYLKIGVNSYFEFCDARYHLSVDKKGKKKIYDRNPKKKGESADNKANEPKELQNIPDHRVQSVTWGSRSSDTQVQLYNKSKELKEVKMKHYIFDTWKAAGLDVERPVYRIEIRIVNEGKSIKNLKTGEKFSLSMNDIITQELLEQLFHDYAKKVFRFYHRRDIKKIQQMKEVKIFSLTNQTLFRPTRHTKKKDYTRMTKIVINTIDKHLAENAKAGNTFTLELEKLREYFIQSYDLEKWVKEHEAEKEYRATLGSRTEQTAQDYYSQKFAGLSDDVAKRAAEIRQRIEEEMKSVNEVLEFEGEDISEIFETDIIRMEHINPF